MISLDNDKTGAASNTVPKERSLWGSGSLSGRDAFDAMGGQSLHLAKTAQAFCPPKPKPLTIATSTVARRAVFGT